MKQHFVIVATILAFAANLVFPQATHVKEDQTAVTEDGRTVILHSDGTWKFAQPKVVTSPTAKDEKGILLFETGLVLGSGDVKPLARQNFYLLPIDVGDASGQDPTKSKAVMEALAQAYYGRDLPKYSEGYNNFMKVVESGAVAKVTTDFTGKAEFAAVPRGTYYLFGIGQIYKQVVVWNLKVVVGSGRASITLDQNNAAAIF